MLFPSLYIEAVASPLVCNQVNNVLTIIDSNVMAKDDTYTNKRVTNDWLWRHCLRESLPVSKNYLNIGHPTITHLNMADCNVGMIDEYLGASYLV